MPLFGHQWPVQNIFAAFLERAPFVRRWAWVARNSVNCVVQLRSLLRPGEWLIEHSAVSGHVLV